MDYLFNVKIYEKYIVFVLIFLFGSVFGQNRYDINRINWALDIENKAISQFKFQSDLDQLGFAKLDSKEKKLRRVEINATLKNLNCEIDNSILKIKLSRLEKIVGFVAEGLAFFLFSVDFGLENAQQRQIQLGVASAITTFSSFGIIDGSARTSRRKAKLQNQLFQKAKLNYMLKDLKSE